MHNAYLVRVVERQAYSGEQFHKLGSRPYFAYTLFMLHIVCQSLSLHVIRNETDHRDYGAGRVLRWKDQQIMDMDNMGKLKRLYEFGLLAQLRQQIRVVRERRIEDLDGDIAPGLEVIAYPQLPPLAVSKVFMEFIFPKATRPGANHTLIVPHKEW